MPPSKLATGAGLEVGFKGGRFGTRSEGNRRFQIPRAAFGGMWTSTLIVLANPLFKVVREARIMDRRIPATPQNVDVVESLHGWLAKP